MPEQHGPRLVTPEPYYVCDGCEHLVGNRILTLTMPPPHYCANVDHLMIPYKPRQKEQLTPAWCPLLPKEAHDAD